MTDERGGHHAVSKFGTVKDAVAWLNGASNKARDVSHKVSDPVEAAYHRGRAFAYGMAADLVEAAVWEDEDEAHD